ncbi:hypothetical protein [Streptomyces achromogenes]|uniref:hypothetical protein n=1 Tax=Streptomyces achromogenes TaxID=67255 RepID=UPI0036A0B06F
MSDLKQSETEWTSDDWHKVCGEFTFRPHLRYRMTDKKKNGVTVWGVQVPDLNSAWWEPEFEFSYEIWTSILVSKGAVNQRGEHSVHLYAVVYREGDGRYTSREQISEFATTQSPSCSFRGTFPMGSRIECDSGKYRVEWSISRIDNDGTRDRQGDGGPQGIIKWDSNAETAKREIAANRNIYG